MSKRLYHKILAFLVACLVSLVLTFLGLRLYYNDARLTKALTRTLASEDLYVLAGQGEKKNGAVNVMGTADDGYSFINAGYLHIDTQFYETVKLVMTGMDAQQSFLLAIRQKGQARAVDTPLAVGQYEVKLADVFAEAVVVGDVGILADSVQQPFQIHTITFIPKKHLSNVAFARLLSESFAINTHWQNWSINSHKPPRDALIPIKMLLLLYFSVVGVLFALYLWKINARIIDAWWVTAIIAWLALDAHYLVEKTVITRNTYDMFAGLTDDEKDLVVSPQAAKLAQTIKSVLPDDGKPKKIRINLGWRWAGLGFEEGDKRYFHGKLQYYLYPNVIYTLGKQIPLATWKQGGFFYVDTRKERHGFTYDAENRLLTVPAGLSVFVKVTRLFARDDVVIYHVHGV